IREPLESLPRPELGHALDRGSRGQLDRLDHGQPVVGQRVGGLLPMELERAQPALLGDRLDVARRVVPENSHRGHERRQPRDDRRRGRWLDIARGALDEDEAERVRTGVAGDPRVLAGCDAAALAFNNSRQSSRTFAATSDARTSASPTRTARAPALTTRSTSSRVKMPLSLTAVWARGTRGSSAREVSRL